MNTSGCPACCWLLFLQYICVVLNHLASPTLQDICPVQASAGTSPDITVYYIIDSSEPDINFPSSSNGKKGHWVGFADNPGDHLTWRIITEDTQKIIVCSGIRSALRTTTNQHLASPSGEGTTLPFPIPYPQQSTNSLPLDPLDESTPHFEQFVKSQSGEDEDNPIHMANIDIPNLLGRSFLLPPEDNGERHIAKIIDIDDHGQPLEDIKFKLKINKDQGEEIMSYNQLMDYIQKGTDAEEDPDSEPHLNFPSSSNEKKGYWVSFADNQGDSFTWRILTEDTQKIIIRSGVHSALRTTTNQRLASPSGEGTTLPFPIPYPQQSTNSLPLDPLDESTPHFEQFVKSQSGEDEDNPIHMANIDIPNLLGRSFLLPPEDNGERHIAKIIDIDDHGQPLEDIKFKLKINKDQGEEIMSYNQLMDYIQKGTDAEEDPDSLFRFRDIVAHQSPLESTDPNHKGSKYNVMVEWESAEVTYEPLTLISKDDPITCAVYAKKHDLLDTTGWKHLKRYAKTSKRLIRALKQSRIRSSNLPRLILMYG